MRIQARTFRRQQNPRGHYYKDPEWMFPGAWTGGKTGKADMGQGSNGKYPQKTDESPSPLQKEMQGSS